MNTRHHSIIIEIVVCQSCIVVANLDAHYVAFNHLVDFSIFFPIDSLCMFFFIDIKVISDDQVSLGLQLVDHEEKLVISYDRFDSCKFESFL